jgi:exonuclease VII small subunit
VLTAVLFGVTQILTATCDYEHTYEKFLSEIVEYLEREVGCFYILDMNAGLSRLNKTMTDGVIKQSAAFDSSVSRLGETLSGALKLTVDEMRKNIEDTVKTVNSYSDVLKKPLNEWKAAVEFAAKTQRKANDAVALINEAAVNFKNMTETAGHSFKDYLLRFENEKAFINEQIDALKQISGAAERSGELAAANKTSLDGVLDYIEKNQAVLDESLGRYELALEQLTVRLGDALGLILNQQIEGAYTDLNARLFENIDRITGSNAELAELLNNLFTEMTAHLKALCGAVNNLKEQMDLQFETLNMR